MARPTATGLLWMQVCMTSWCEYRIASHSMMSVYPRNYCCYCHSMLLPNLSVYCYRLLLSLSFPNIDFNFRVYYFIMSRFPSYLHMGSYICGALLFVMQASMHHPSAHRQHGGALDDRGAARNAFAGGPLDRGGAPPPPRPRARGIHATDTRHNHCRIVQRLPCELTNATICKLVATICNCVAPGK